MQQIKHIRLDKIKPPEFDVRLTNSPEDDIELQESIRELGILEPLIVKEITDGVEIIAGNRRFNAAGVVGLPAVPCIIIKTTGAHSDKIQMHENLKRLPLSHIDQAHSFAHLIKEYNFTETQISALCAVSISYVSQHLALLHADDNLLSAVHSNQINFSVARELNQCKDPEERHRLQDIVIENGASSEVVRNWVKEANRETDNINHEHDLEKQRFPTQEPVIPMYPCAVCKTATRYDNIHLIRMCPGCNNLFFMTIEQDRQQQRIKSTTTGDPGCS
ncbi:Nucleoid occlusion protein [subsurface metagenome]